MHASLTAAEAAESANAALEISPLVKEGNWKSMLAAQQDCPAGGYLVKEWQMCCINDTSPHTYGAMVRGCCPASLQALDKKELEEKCPREAGESYLEPLRYGVTSQASRLSLPAADFFKSLFATRDKLNVKESTIHVRWQDSNVPLSPITLKHRGSTFRPNNPTARMAKPSVKLYLACILFYLSSFIHATVLPESTVPTSLPDNSIDIDIDDPSLRYVNRDIETLFGTNTYAMSCFEDLEKTRKCQASDYQYFCNSAGKLVRNGAFGNIFCDDHCWCINLTPKSLCTFDLAGFSYCARDLVNYIGAGYRSVFSKRATTISPSSQEHTDLDMADSSFHQVDRRDDPPGCNANDKFTVRLYAADDWYDVFVPEAGKLHNLGVEPADLMCKGTDPGRSSRDFGGCISCFAHHYYGLAVVSDGRCGITYTTPEKSEYFWLTKADGIIDLGGNAFSIVCFDYKPTMRRNIDQVSASTITSSDTPRDCSDESGTRRLVRFYGPERSDDLFVPETRKAFSLGGDNPDLMCASDSSNTYSAFGVLDQGSCLLTVGRPGDSQSYWADKSDGRIDTNGAPPFSVACYDFENPEKSYASSLDLRDESLSALTSSQHAPNDAKGCDVGQHNTFPVRLITNEHNGDKDVYETLVFPDGQIHWMHDPFPDLYCRDRYTHECSHCDDLPQLHGQVVRISAVVMDVIEGLGHCTIRFTEQREGLGRMFGGDIWPNNWFNLEVPGFPAFIICYYHPDTPDPGDGLSGEAISGIGDTEPAAALAFPTVKPRAEDGTTDLILRDAASSCELTLSPTEIDFPVYFNAPGGSIRYLVYVPSSTVKHTYELGGDSPQLQCLDITTNKCGKCDFLTSGVQVATVPGEGHCDIEFSGDPDVRLDIKLVSVIPEFHDYPIGFTAYPKTITCYHNCDSSGYGPQQGTPCDPPLNPPRALAARDVDLLDPRAEAVSQNMAVPEGCMPLGGFNGMSLRGSAAGYYIMYIPDEGLPHTVGKDAEMSCLELNVRTRLGGECVACDGEYSAVSLSSGKGILHLAKGGDFKIIQGEGWKQLPQTSAINAITCYPNADSVEWPPAMAAAVDEPVPATKQLDARSMTTTVTFTEWLGPTTTAVRTWTDTYGDPLTTTISRTYTLGGKPSVYSTDREVWTPLLEPHPVKRTIEQAGVTTKVFTDTNTFTVDAIPTTNTATWSVIQGNTVVYTDILTLHSNDKASVTETVTGSTTLACYVGGNVPGCESLITGTTTFDTRPTDSSTLDAVAGTNDDHAEGAQDATDAGNGLHQNGANGVIAGFGLIVACLTIMVWL
ncbi:hypothetical protein LTR64_000090 [Lithohypha guttulata]|uniref:uncharacterized protein n=1 Tax=Lithohypha guttulata TaxID=1690604 RepID=UPI002DDFFA30|nr:hypothetical protein LTR51_007452 [Lithohypha guttulata]